MSNPTDSVNLDQSIEHCENKAFTQSELFENEIGPGALQFQRSRHVLSFLSRFSEIFADCMRVEG